MKTQNNSYAWYALRRTLPPWSFEDNLKELIEYLPKYKVDEVIVKVDTEEFSHGQPPLDWVRKYQNNLFEIKKELDKLGIVYSLNPWITQSHNDRGRNSIEYLPGLRTMVGHDGAECTCCACPLSSVWREHIKKIWTLYAETRPHIIWVEDDIRTFNHQPVRFSCFCPLHLERFSERVGEKVSREELVAAILKEGEVHPWRKEYLDMQAEIMIDTVKFLAETVHKISPDTSMGLMSSGARYHCLEGRRWREFAGALADGRQLYSRPPMSNYSENSLRGFYYSHDSIKLTRYVLPDNIIEQTEVENAPFTRYSKSVNFTFLEMAISFAYGSHGVTMNLFDHCGTPMEDEKHYGKMLAAKKDYLNNLAKYASLSGEYRGIRLLHHELASYVKKLPGGADYSELEEDGYSMMEVFESLGLPTTYSASDIIATSGQVINAFSDDEITEFLSKGLFIDAAAAQVLWERGFGEHIGIKSIKPPVCIDTLGALSAEEYFNSEFGGKEKKFLTLTVPSLGGRPRLSLIEPDECASVISMTVDPDTNRKHPCMVAFENKIGGRVVIHPLVWDGITSGRAFLHPFRKEQIYNAVKWLSHNKIPVYVYGDGVYPLAFRKDIKDNGKEFIISGFFNLSLDPWYYVNFEIHSEIMPTQIYELTDKGEWAASDKINMSFENNKLKICYKDYVPFDKPLIFKIVY